MQPTREETFAAAVKEAREQRGWPQAKASAKTGVDRFTISRMEQGLIPRLDIVERWARGLGEDVNHWREIAGFSPVHNTVHRIWEELDGVRQRTGEDFKVSWRDLMLLRERPDELKQYVARLERTLQENP